MATKLAKILICINVALSLMLAAFALGVATNRIDWAGTATAPDREGELARKQADVKQLQDAYVRGAKRWQGELASFYATEAKRPVDQAWYARQLRVLQGDVAPAANEVAVGMMTYDAGKLKLDKDNRPELKKHDDARLLPMKTMLDQISQTEGDIAAEIKKTNDLIKEEEKLTFALNGRMGQPKGLRDLLAESLLTQQNAAKELLTVKEPRINRKVESELLLKRNQELKNRVEELKKVGVASK